MPRYRKVDNHLEVSAKRVWKPFVLGRIEGARGDWMVSHPSELGEITTAMSHHLFCRLYEPLSGEAEELMNLPTPNHDPVEPR